MASLLEKLWSWLFPTKTSAEAAWVSLSGEDLTCEGEVSGFRRWRFPDGDAVSVHFFARPPDLPKARSIKEFRTRRMREVSADGVKLVEVEIDEVDGLHAVRTIAKVPQVPSGMTYVGAYTLPFARCSYVVKVQCEERGFTGGREAVLADRRLADGSIKIVPNRPPVMPDDWNPDAAEHDEKFPDHPVSRARRHLRSLAKAIWIDERLRQEPRFDLP